MRRTEYERVRDAIDRGCKTTGEIAEHDGRRHVFGMSKSEIKRIADQKLPWANVRR
jgi:hypothetical protein